MTWQLLLGAFGFLLAAILGVWGVLTYFNGQNKTLWASTEGHILEAIRELKKQVSEIRSEREKDHERIHLVELGFKDLKAEMAEKYISRPEINRLREDMSRDVANIRSMCARRHGEASS